MVTVRQPANLYGLSQEGRWHTLNFGVVRSRNGLSALTTEESHSFSCVECQSYTMGDRLEIDPEDTVHAKLFIMWRINAVSTNMHQVLFAEKARKNGA